MKTLLITSALFLVARVACAQPLNVNTKGPHVEAETFEISCVCEGATMVCVDVVTSGPNAGARTSYRIPSAPACAAEVK
jgi:hypothetical protein